MTQIQLRDKKFEVFLKEEIILAEIERVAQEVNADLKGKDPLFVCVLNGAFLFAAELIKRFDSACEITFIRLSSYEGVNRKESLKEIQGLMENVENRNVVIVEDIIDTGRTMEYLLNLLKEKKPATVKIATLLFKPNAVRMAIKPDYIVKEIPNDFIVGFGLDYNGHGRNLRNIYKITD
ncbi:MAG: hypoxanthine phosphoribosyltransferase [Dysgonamonadaceae bacterium]|jgi:hypoxanthine phosphoribosyltransferase|nr:hypoxanthine phosphoribosyltransferase [Dysgonamonadaceae bacterium]